MFAFLAYAAALVGLIVDFFAPRWAWLPIGLIDAWIIVTLRSVQRGYRFESVPTLSDRANRLLTRFGHFYAAPAAGGGFSAAASTMTLAGVAIGVVGAFKHFYLALLIAAINYLVMGYIAWQFNPVRVLRGDDAQAHAELVKYLESGTLRHR